MDKSLATKIKEQTRLVMEKRETEKRERNKEIVFQLIKEEVERKAKKGKPLFIEKEKLELDVEMKIFTNKINLEDMEIALKEIGFEIHKYPRRVFIGIPKEKMLTKEIVEILAAYDAYFAIYKQEEEKTADSDCQKVLDFLEKGSYDVDDVDKVTVYITSSSDTSFYTECVKEKMKKNGFDICIRSKCWEITVL